MSQGDSFEYLPFLKKVYILFGAMTINSLLISTVIYPIDTLKKQLQVNSSLGFRNEYDSLSQAISKFYSEGVKNMYR